MRGGVTHLTNEMFCYTIGWPMIHFVEYLTDQRESLLHISSQFRCGIICSWESERFTSGLSGISPCKVYCRHTTIRKVTVWDTTIKIYSRSSSTGKIHCRRATVCKIKSRSPTTREIIGRNSTRIIICPWRTSKCGWNITSTVTAFISTNI